MICVQGKSIAQVAIRWLLEKEGVSSVVIGAKTCAQLEDNLGASGPWSLTGDQVGEPLVMSPHRTLLCLQK